jgi:hypothetical protein
MGKSDCKGLLAELAPQCFALATPSAETAIVVLEDSCVRMQNMIASLKRDSRTYTVDEMAERFFLPIVHAVQQPCQTKVYVALFDKPSFVTVAKQPEQRSRDRARTCGKRSREDEPAYKSVFPNVQTALKGVHAGKFEMVASTLYAEFNHDRNFKYFYTKLIVQRGAELLPEMMRKGKVSPDCRIIVDAEFLTDDSHTPVVCTSSCASDDTDLVAELKNELGEFDVANTHYIRSPMLQAIAGDGGFLIETVDTDLLFVATQQSQAAGYASRVRVRCTLPPSKDKYDFDPAKASEWIDRIIDGPSVDLLVEAYSLAGSDFCKGCPGIGNRTFLSGYLEHRGRVTPADYFKQCWGKYMVSGVRRASSTKASGETNRQQRCMEEQCKRAEYVTGYWKHSGVAQELVPSPLGRGFALVSGFVEYAEDLDVVEQ